MLELYIDFKCPASYLALKPSLDLAAKRGADIHFKAFNSKQISIPVHKDKESKSETHIRVRAEQNQNIHEHYAKLQGLELSFPEEPGETLPALVLLANWHGDPLPFIHEAFAAYWQKGEDLSSFETVQIIASKAGKQLTKKDLQSYCASFKEEMLNQENGPVFTTPTYLVADQVFVGRENLPWIAEILDANL